MKTSLLKNFLVLAFLLLFVFGVSATGTQEQTKSKGVVKITVWDFKYGDKRTHEVMDKVDSAFMELHPNIKVDHQPQPFGNYYDMLKASAAANSGPDVALLHAEKRAWVLADVLLDLDSYVAPWKDEVRKIAWDASKAKEDGSIKLIPITQQGFGMYYNKKLFKQAGLDPDNPPAEEDAFLNASQKLKDAGIIPIGEQRKGYPKSMMYMKRMMFANAYGPNLSKTVINYTDPVVKAFVYFMVKLRDKGYFDPDANSMNYWSDVLPKFESGKLGMIYGLLSDIAHWKMFSDALGKDNVGYFPNINLKAFPYKNQQYLMGAGIGYGVFKWSPHKKEAVQFASFYGQTKGASIFMKGLGAMSPNKNINMKEFYNYPVLKVIIGWMNKNPVLGKTPSIPLVAQKAFEEQQSMRLMLGEITADQFISICQKILESERAAKSE